MGQTNRRWTVARRRAVTAHVAQLAATLRLSDWDIRLDFDTPAPDGADASVTPVWAQRRATVQFGAQFLALSSADQRQTLVHELLHCHLFALHEAVRRVIANVPAGARRLAEDGVNFEVEAAVDVLADAVWPLLPAWDLEQAAAAPRSQATLGVVTARAVG